MRATVVVANAPWRWHAPFVELVRGAECVLAADGGANHLARIGVRPDAVVGDLDSIRPGVRRWVGEERMVVRADQDFTDLHKTLAFAFDERGARQVIVLAATGGRLDHDLENLALLVRWASRGSLELRDERHRVVPVIDETELATTAGQGISLMPVGRCERVWTEGPALGAARRAARPRWKDQRLQPLGRRPRRRSGWRAARSWCSSPSPSRADRIAGVQFKMAGSPRILQAFYRLYFGFWIPTLVWASTRWPLGLMYWMARKLVMLPFNIVRPKYLRAVKGNYAGSSASPRVTRRCGGSPGRWGTSTPTTGSTSSAGRNCPPERFEANVEAVEGERALPGGARIRARHAAADRAHGQPGGRGRRPRHPLRAGARAVLA